MLAETLGCSVVELGHRVSSHEFTQWMAFYSIRARVRDAQSRHPNWGMAEILDWVKSAQELHRRGKGK